MLQNDPTSEPARRYGPWDPGAAVDPVTGARFPAAEVAGVPADDAHGCRADGGSDPMGEDEVAEHRARVVRHRESVVRRLLARGLSATTLVALLPDFRPAVQRLLSRD